MILVVLVVVAVDDDDDDDGVEGVVIEVGVNVTEVADIGVNDDDDCDCCDDIAASDDGTGQLI